VTAPAGTDVGLAFVTGLTTGGLSCLAVQAGLLATSVARQAETDVVAELAANHLINRKRKRSGRKLTRSQRRREREALSVLEAPVRPKRRRALPLLLFLGAKLAAYTVLGLLLGWLGSVIQLSPYSRAALQVGIGIFMLVRLDASSTYIRCSATSSSSRPASSPGSSAASPGTATALSSPRCSWER